MGRAKEFFQSVGKHTEDAYWKATNPVGNLLEKNPQDRTYYDTSERAGRYKWSRDAQARHAKDTDPNKPNWTHDKYTKGFKPSIW